MVDLHTHILPSVDDGAKTINDARRLLMLEQEQGVDKVVFTPHFNIDNVPLADFLSLRQRSYDILMQDLSDSPIEIDMEIKLGAEVFLSPTLLNEDLELLCITGTNYLLVEFPTDYYRPWFKKVLYDILSMDIVPVIAHIERYPYFHDEFEALVEIVNIGVLTQVNASSIVKHNSLKNLIIAFIKHDLVYCISSDTHSEDKRPPVQESAIKILKHHLGENAISALMKNGQEIFAGREVEEYISSLPKKFFGRIF